MKRLESLDIKYVTYWETCPQSFYEAHLERERSAGHAGEFETSFAMVNFPDRIRDDQINYENAKLATIPKGGHILSAIIDGVTEQVQQMLDQE